MGQDVSSSGDEDIRDVGRGASSASAANVEKETAASDAPAAGRNSSFPAENGEKKKRTVRMSRPTRRGPSHSHPDRPRAHPERVHAGDEHAGDSIGTIRVTGVKVIGRVSVNSQLSSVIANELFFSNKADKDCF